MYKVIYFLVLIICSLSSQTSLAVGSAVRTYNGTDGMANVFFGPSGEGCTDCHNSSYGQTPYWNNYATINNATNKANIIARVGNGTMPPGGASNPSYITTWNSNGWSEYAAPYIATGSSSNTVRNGTNSYSRDLSWTVNENGANTTFTAYYRISGGWLNSSVTSPAGSGGGGSASNTTASRTISGLTCGSTWNYYLSGTNTGGTSSGEASNQNTFIITCNQGISLSGSPGNATEASLFTWTPTKTDLDGAGSTTATIDTPTYSFSVGPTVTGGNTANTPSINPGTGQISWTPTEGNTQATFTIQVTDSSADTNITHTLPVTINVTSVANKTPVITTASIANGTEDTTNYNIAFTASDADVGAGDSSSHVWSIQAKSDPQMNITSGGVFTWSPVEGEAGPHSVTIRVTDSGGLFDEEIYNFTINPDNSNPIISNEQSPGVMPQQAATEGTLFSLDLDATDADIGAGDASTHVWSIISPVSPPDDMNINSSTGVLTWTPTTEANLIQSVTIRVTDNLGGTDTTSVNIVVTAIDDNPPIITTTTLAGATQAVTYSQTLAFTDADIDGDNWTWSISSAPIVQPANAAPTNPFNLDPVTGEITWTPANNEDSLQFTARITDSDGDFDDQILTINIADQNFAPSISNPQAPEGTIADQAATENSMFSIDIDSTDPDDGDTATWTIRSALLDDMSIDINGVFRWTPTTDDPLIHHVVIRVTDSGGLYDEVGFDVHVTPVIDNPPVITTVQGDLPVNTLEDHETFSHVLTWIDADTSGDGWTWSLTARDDPAIAINPGTGEVTWSPVEGDGEIGSFSFTARVTDNGGFWDQITLTITVAEDNDAPTISGKPIAAQAATEDVLFSIDLDRTDPDVNDTQSWAITSPLSLPDDMAIDNNGVLSWTPSEGIDRVQVVTVEVTDEGGLSDSHSFSIHVTAVNDAPVFDAPIPDGMSVEEHSTFTHTIDYVSDSDPQDNPFNEHHTFAITHISPTPNSAGPQISNTGVISWTPGNNDARTVDANASEQSYTIEVTIADGGEDGQGPAVASFILLVTLLDSDGDTIPDYEDNCPTDANTLQENFDGDAQGDICDPDDDNDGISDIAENYHPELNPFDNTDAAGDIDGDGLTNLEEFNICTGGDIYSLDTCENMRIDSVPPVIAHNGDFNLIAAGYTTFVDFKAYAVDGNDGAVEIYSNTTNKHFRPGDHVVIWSAEDGIPNIAQVEQHITIHPLVSLGGSQLLAEGSSTEVAIHVSGDIPADDFPLIITYSVSGSASSPSDFTITPASPIVINDMNDLQNGKFILTVNSVNDGIGEGNENLIISLNSLSAGPAFGQNTAHEIILVEGQVAPTLNLTAQQNGIETRYLFGDQGSVTVSANANDGNGDSLTYDWSASDAALAGVAAGDDFTISNPLALSSSNLPASYQVVVTVSDGTHNVTQSMTLMYMADVLSLTSVDTDGDGINDDIEGLGDSDGDGIPDYLDAYDNPPNLLYAGNNQLTNEAPDFIEVESGYQIQLGQYGLANNEQSPNLNSTDLKNLGVTIKDVGFVPFGNLYEFVITGLSPAKPDVRVVIPLGFNIPPGAVYRKFDGEQWFTYIEDGLNSISSASSDENGCPAPGHEAYQAGLLPFRDCIQLQISDGGGNDIDGSMNGTIVDPGGLALPDNAQIFEPDNTPDESSLFGSGGPSSSGKIPLSILFGLILLSLYRWRGHSSKP